MVDDADYEWLSQWKWHANGQLPYVYAMRSLSVGGRRQKPIAMHREILGITAEPRTVYVDHKNHNTLDNRRSNLRQCGNKGNQGNRQHQQGSSGYRGVSLNKQAGTWRARLIVDCKERHLGNFADERDAAVAYDAAAIEHFGEFAKLNFPPD